MQEHIDIKVNGKSNRHIISENVVMPFAIKLSEFVCTHQKTTVAPVAQCLAHYTATSTSWVQTQARGEMYIEFVCKIPSCEPQPSEGVTAIALLVTGLVMEGR